MRQAVSLQILLVLAMASLPWRAMPETSKARCLIKQNDRVAYSGACQLEREKDGSFAIKRSGNRAIVPNITNISVSIVSTGVAEVRGLTTGGNNSRWGTARKSNQNPTCWTGSDFEVCVN